MTGGTKGWSVIAIVSLLLQVLPMLLTPSLPQFGVAAASCEDSSGFWDVSPHSAYPGEPITLSGDGTQVNGGWYSGLSVHFDLQDANGTWFSLGTSTVHCDSSNHPILQLSTTVPSNAATGQAWIKSTDGNNLVTCCMPMQITSQPKVTVRVNLTGGDVTLPTGNSVTLTAFVTDSVQGMPVDGVAVSFQVTGANQSTATVIDSGGRADFTYTGMNPGSDSITATADGVTSNSQSIQWHSVPSGYKWPWDQSVSSEMVFTAAPHAWAGIRSGIDFSDNNTKTPILAMKSGTVVQILDESSDYEKTHPSCRLLSGVWKPCNGVRVRDDQGFEILYLHLSSYLPDLQVGKTHVEQGQLIGYEGKSGADAVHIHIQFFGNDSSHSPLDLNGVSIDGWTIYTTCTGFQDSVKIGSGTCDTNQNHYSTGFLSKDGKDLLANADNGPNTAEVKSTNHMKDLITPDTSKNAINQTWDRTRSPVCQRAMFNARGCGVRLHS